MITNGATAISVKDVSKKYDLYTSPKERLKELFHPFARKYHREFWALAGISVDAMRGETVGVVGPNGSGKSTLLQIICGVLTPTQGTVFTAGRISSLLELGVGFHPDYTGRENVYMSGAIIGLSGAAVDAHFPAVEAFAEIGEYIDQPLKTYSSGMLVRLAFATAINVDPDILVIDEALAVGDAYFQQKCIRKLRQFQDEGKTILFVSHDPSAVKTLCHRAILLEEGRLLQTGRPGEILDYYQGRLLQKMHAGEKNVSIQAVKAGAISDPSRSYQIGTGQVILEEVKLLDADDREIEYIESEQLLKICVTLRFDAAFNDPHVGFILRNRLGQVIFGTNTYTSGLRLSPVEKGDSITVEFSFACTLSEGDYSISIGTANGGFNSGNFEEYLFLEHAVKIIRVVKNPGAIEYEGVVNLFPEITFKKSAPRRDVQDGYPRDSAQLFSDQRYQSYVRKGEKIRPIMLICETVNTCSNDCLVCAYGRMKREKCIMPIDLFDKVLHDYSDMGGGVLSLTPMVGDIFLDPFLVERIVMIKRYDNISKISFTTNAVMSDTLADDDLANILKMIDNVHISVYGMDREEYRTMTRRDFYGRLVRNIQRIIRLIDDPRKVRLGFRFLKVRSEQDIKEWIIANCGRALPFGYTNCYANWGNTCNTDEPLPLDAAWLAPQENKEQCLIPIVAPQVFANGDVSFCHCCDFDAIDEFLLGNVRDQSLLTLFNSEKSKRLLGLMNNNVVPSFCRKCTFFRPFSDLKNYSCIPGNPLDFIGG